MEDKNQSELKTESCSENDDVYEIGNAVSDVEGENDVTGTLVGEDSGSLTELLCWLRLFFFKRK